MKVLHCIPGMGGGGAERQLAYLAGPLATLGWEVHVALATGGPNLARLIDGGAVVHRLHTRHNYDPALVVQLARVMRSVRPDLVQVWFVQMELVAGLLALWMRVPLVVSERSSVLAYPRSIKNALRLVVGSRAKAVIANSAAGEAYWRERARRGPSVAVVPNALPLAEIEAARPGLPAGLPIDDDDFVVLFAGRFGPEKNVGALVKALAALVADDPRCRAVLCGDGPDRGATMRDLERRGLAGRVFTPGYIDPLWPLLKRANVVVAPSLFEGRPNTVIEAMAAGCPLIVSDIPAHREVLDAGSALWIDPADPLSIRDAIRQVWMDPAAASRRAAAARGRAAQYSIAAAAAGYDRVYRAVVLGSHAVEAAR